MDLYDNLVYKYLTSDFGHMIPHRDTEITERNKNKTFNLTAKCAKNTKIKHTPCRGALCAPAKQHGRAMRAPMINAVITMAA